MKKDPGLFWACVDMSGGPDACWPWKTVPADGDYARVWWGDESRLTNSVAFELENGWRPSRSNGQCVRHTCDWKPCCNPCHLVAGTHVENMGDARARRLFAHGEAHVNAVFTEAQIVEMRALYAAGRSVKSLQRQFGCAYTTARRICHEQTWRHLLEAA